MVDSIIQTCLTPEVREYQVAEAVDIGEERHTGNIKIFVKMRNPNWRKAWEHMMKIGKNCEVKGYRSISARCSLMYFCLKIKPVT